MTSYRTLKGPGKVQKDFKNSVFIGYAQPASSEEEARNFVERIKQAHSDANHNVSAYLINSGDELAMRYDDDGEPAGSSGKPIFKVLELKDISDVVVVVTRYFGGIKLGFGGLSRAYRETAVAAIEEAGIIEVQETVRLKIIFEYHDIQKIKKLVEDFGTISSEDYSDVVEFTIDVVKEMEEEFVKRLSDLTKDKARIEFP